MTAIDEKVLDKIRKCLNLGASTNPHEAAAAMARAQELMAKHGVSAEQLESREVAGKKGPVVLHKEGVKSRASATKAKSWELKLMDAVAKAFGCGLLFSPSYPYASYLFVGVTEEAQLARYAADVLSRQLGRGRAAFTADLPSYLERRAKTAEVDAYCAGWVAGAVGTLRPLTEARRDAAKQLDAGDGGSRALMVVSQDERTALAIRDHLATYTGKTKLNTRTGADGSSDAYWRGKVEGSRATINRALKS